MKKHPKGKILLGLALALLVGTGFCGEADRQDEELDAGVVLGEEDLAERAEIARNMFRRITPLDEPFVQDVGTWPVAWEEFPSRWNGAATGREYGAWVVPVSVEQENGATVIRDADGMELWRGTTDFAKEESASVTLTGGLVGEEEWDGYEAVRNFVENMSRQDAESLPTRGAVHTNGLRFTSLAVDTNGTVEVSLAWEEDGEADIFVYAIPHEPEIRIWTWTNDENQVVTTTNTFWNMVGTNLSGFDNDWEWRGTAVITNGEGLFVDTNIPAYLGIIRFYAAAEANDTDGDGLNDGMERFVFHTDPTVPNNGNPNPSGTNGTTNVFWIVQTTNEMHWWLWLGTNLPPQPQSITNFPIPGARPTTNSVVQDVRITGFVDDILCVDGNVIGGWDAGTTNFTDISIFGQATNVQSGTLDLQIWDWPDPNHEGDNEAKLGYSYEDPFRVEWTWAVPMEFRLEHITTNGAPLVVNPSGTEPNREITCMATVLPTNIPDSDIHWDVSGAGMAFAGGTNFGRVVHLTATRTGDWVAIVTVSNSTLRPARLRGTVLEKKDVNVYLHIVRDDDGKNPAMTVEHFDGLLRGANTIFEQAAIEFHRAGNVMYTNNSDWQVISTTDNWAEDDALQSWDSHTEGIEVYCIQNFESNLYNGVNLNSSDARAGMTIAASATARSLAHELGHACGLNDIYTNRIVNGVTNEVPNVPVASAFSPRDWCQEAPNGGYGDLTLHPLVCSLLMYGVGTPDAVDIPADWVYGIDQNMADTMVSVGLSNMKTRAPKHW